MTLGLKQISNDEQVDEFVQALFENDLRLSMYTEHQGYDVLEMVQNDNLCDDTSDSDFEDVDKSEYLEDLNHVVDFQTEGEENVVIPKLSTDDPWLNRLVGKGKFVGEMENLIPNLHGRFMVEENDLLILNIRDVDAGKCAGKRGKKQQPKDEIEPSNSDGNKGKEHVVRFRNDHFGVIMGYGDYVIGDSVISRVYYVEGLGYNFFSVGQFCDSDLEVAFQKHLCYVKEVNGVELIKGNRGTNLYTISIEDMLKSSPIYLLSKASKNKSWLWHRRLNHLNFGIINDLFRKDLFLRSKDETPEFVIKFLKQIQVGLNKTVRYIRTDNGTEFVNQVQTDYYESVGIFHQKSVSRTPQQNSVVERRNRTFVEAARTMLIFSKAPMFLWAEAVATACYTQNRSLIHTRHNKTPYELVHNKKPDLKFLCVFGALCYPQMTAKTLED
ncbi:integrase, catalytic region, zinc finger, CCHC-type containing protein [Tanacetum coccineum]